MADNAQLLLDADSTLWFKPSSLMIQKRWNKLHKAESLDRYLVFQARLVYSFCSGEEWSLVKPLFHLLLPNTSVLILKPLHTQSTNANMKFRKPLFQLNRTMKSLKISLTRYPNLQMWHLLEAKMCTSLKRKVHFCMNVHFNTDVQTETNIIGNTAHCWSGLRGERKN